MRCFIYGVLLSIGSCLLIFIIRAAYVLYEINKYMKTRGLTEVSLEEINDYLDSK